MGIKKITQLFFVFCFLFLYENKGQNLVKNWSFESFSICPNLQPSDLNVCLNWNNPNVSSPDYLNSCSPNGSGYSTPWNSLGFQVPFDSNAYAGAFFFDKLNPNTREYLTGEFSIPLSSGVKYYVSYMANLASDFGYSVSTLGAYFTTAQPSVSDYYYWQVTPQIENKYGNIDDTLNWVLVADTFTAVGGEQFITIGNFRPDSLSDTLNLYSGPYYYYAAYYFIDAVTVIPYDQVGVSELKTLEEDVVIYPNPSCGNFTVDIKKAKGNSQLEIFSVDGRLIKQFNLPVGSEKFTIEVENIKNGVYFCKIKEGSKIVKTEKIVLLND